MSRVRQASRRGLRRVRERLGDAPVFLPIVLACTPEGFTRRIRPETEIVIEGFPRSGNTFAVHALRLAQARPVAIASHVHVPAQVKLAVQRGLPTMVALRPPEDAVASLLVFAPHVRPADALAEYAHHHQQLAPYSGGFLVAPFEVITTAMGDVIDACNARFGTSFLRFEHTPESTAAVFESIEGHHERIRGEALPETQVPRPSVSRADLIPLARSRVHDPDVRSELGRARSAYERLRSLWP